MPSKMSNVSKTELKSHDKLELQIHSAIVIQRNFRLFLWRKFFRNLSIEQKYTLSRTEFNSQIPLNISNAHS